MKIPNDIEAKAAIVGDLNVNNNALLKIRKGRNRYDYIVHVDYDGICWKYTITPDVPFSGQTIDQICSDFDGEGRAKCFMYRILDQRLISIILDRY